LTDQLARRNGIADAFVGNILRLRRLDLKFRAMR
jgi:hypothetical protein